ncbi:putative pectinesterase 63 [Nymphaea colorata]|nr:putative pectinesterase 63 [Nymphaea colorata]
MQSQSLLPPSPPLPPSPLEPPLQHFADSFMLGLSKFEAASRMAGERQPSVFAFALCKTLFLLSLLAVPLLAASSGNKSPVLVSELLQAEAKRKIITVSKDGTGDFQTVTDAVNSIKTGNSQRIIIHIKSGIYTEKVTIDRSKPFVTFYGDRNAMPTIRFGGRAAVYTTMFSATVAVESNYFMAVNIIFENSAPKPRPGEKGGQAVAMRISGDNAAFYNCRFLGFQDTLYDHSGRHYFKNCLIQGSVDFIFGNGRSLYEGCVLKSVADNVGVTAMVAQGRNSSNDAGGFSFVGCNVTGSGSAHLGRAWRGYSKVVFSYSYFSSVVNTRGWDQNGFPSQNLVFGEYKCMGPGANRAGRVKYARSLTDQQAAPFLSTTYIGARNWLLSPPSL